MSDQVKYKNYTLGKVFFSILISFAIMFGFDFVQVQAESKGHSKFKHRAHNSQEHKDKRHKTKGRRAKQHKVKQHKLTKEEERAAKEKAAHDATEARLIEGKNAILARAYRLYDSGTSENLQGNHKYAVLQLKLADELLKEHGQANTSLATSTLIELASAAQAAKDYPLAKSTYERLLVMHPQDRLTLLNVAKLEASQSNFDAAQNYVNRLLEINPNNAEARLLADFIVTKLKPIKK